MYGLTSHAATMKWASTPSGSNAPTALAAPKTAAFYSKSIHYKKVNIQNNKPTVRRAYFIREKNKQRTTLKHIACHLQHLHNQTSSTPSWQS
jgi:hypothetical protein